jgi:hypothetical protein
MEVVMEVRASRLGAPTIMALQ